MALLRKKTESRSINMSPINSCCRSCLNICIMNKIIINILKTETFYILFEQGLPISVFVPKTKKKRTHTCHYCLKLFDVRTINRLSIYIPAITILMFKNEDYQSSESSSPSMVFSTFFSIK